MCFVTFVVVFGVACRFVLGYLLSAVVGWLFVGFVFGLTLLLLVGVGFWGLVVYFDYLWDFAGCSDLSLVEDEYSLYAFYLEGFVYALLYCFLGVFAFDDVAYGCGCGVG